MEVGFCELPRDILDCIIKLTAKQTIRGTWACLATFRLVCKRLAAFISREHLEKAMREDLANLPTVCVGNGVCRQQHFVIMRNRGDPDWWLRERQTRQCKLLGVTQEWLEKTKEVLTVLPCEQLELNAMKTTVELVKNSTLGTVAAQREVYAFSPHMIVYFQHQYSNKRQKLC